MQQKIRLVIAGNEYYVNTDDEQHIRELAADVDRRLTDMSRENPCLSTTMAAVLCALQLRDEKSQCDRDIAELKDRVRRAEADSASATIEANEAVREIRRLTDELLRLRREK